MTAMRRTGRRLLADDSGATAIEYALLAALIAGVIIAAVARHGADARRHLLAARTPELVEHMRRRRRSKTMLSCD